MPHDHHAPEIAFGVFPLLGLLLALPLLLGFAGWYLWRQGRLPSLWPPRSAEEDAKRVLADRFARDDLSAEEFLDRASVLNWTPGVAPLPRRRRRRG